MKRGAPRVLVGTLVFLGVGVVASFITTAILENRNPSVPIAYLVGIFVGVACGITAGLTWAAITWEWDHPDDES